MVQGGERDGDAGDILVVDDDEDLRSSVAALLEDEGYTVRTCANGKEAVEAIERARPALVVLDLMMPVMSGWEVVEWVKSYEVVSIDRLLILTAASERCPAALPMIAKPFHADQLLAAVRERAPR
jgi:DNA-binding response OmpR family regulator